MERLSNYTKQIRIEEDVRFALKSLERHFFVKNKPHRHISGIALASEEVRGHKVCVAGAQFELPCPLLFNHDFTYPLGKVTSIEIRGGEILFKAEIANGIAWCDELWEHIKSRKLAAASINPVPLHERVSDNTFHLWKLAEISVLQVGADTGAVLTRCWEQDPVVHLDRPSTTTHWSVT
jgi:hypothetical protein